MADDFAPFKPLSPNGLQPELYGQYRIGVAVEYIAKALGMLVALKMEERGKK